MAFSLSGRVAAGAQDELQEMLAQALQREQMEQSGRLQQQRIDQDQSQFEAQQAFNQEQAQFNRDRATLADARDYEEQQERGIRDMRAFTRGVTERSIERNERDEDIAREEARETARRGERVEDRDFAANLQRELLRNRPGQAPDYQWVKMPDGSLREVPKGRAPEGSTPYEKPTGTGAAQSGGLAETGIFIRGMKGLSDKIHTLGPGASRVGGMWDKAQAAAGFDDDANQYQRQLEVFTPMLARLVGHVGVLTQLDVESAQKLLPPMGASKTEAARAWQNVDDFLKAKGVNLNLAQGGTEPPPTDLRADPNAPPVVVQWERDASGKPVPRRR